MRLAAKRDANEAEIVQALEAIGCTVLRLSGDGVPDLLTFRAGQWLPIEIKSPGGALTASQRHLKAIADFPVVETVEEALALFQIFPEWNNATVTRLLDKCLGRG